MVFLLHFFVFLIDCLSVSTALSSPYLRPKSTTTPAESINVSYDMAIANMSVWLSATTYCDPETYSKHNFKDAAEGFTFAGQFSSKRTDMQGFYGYHTAMKLIVIVYRGTESFVNTWDDLMTRPVNADIVDCPNCRAHNGMKICKDSTIASVLPAVKNLTTQFPDYHIIMTGHSLGAAVATLSAIDIIQAGYSVSLYTFGSPRVVNKAFSEYITTLFSKLPDIYQTYRFTHWKDIFVHIPYESMGYLHIDREIYENENHDLYVCMDGPEDILCAEQWGFYQCEIDDHLTYLGLFMDCGSV